ncbi:C-X-C chemokine receptor type 1 [Betta splendens]|uniref:C-X-C chemokine receptor type 1 n=1 Tax=Betta splendens TaxID=158456 RepID=A0A6P7LIF2_BETSP|nr:C-X-C chemokine receptor type 1 [Betta splendens]
MEIKVFILIVLCLVLTRQEEENASGTDEDYYSTLDYNSSEPCDIYVPGFSSLGLMVTYFIVFAFSVIGNAVVVYVVGSMTKGRASTDVYLMHLALADLVFTLTLPFWAVEHHFGWIFPGFLCKALSGLQEASVYSGVFLLASISVDRYFAIVRATRVLPSHHLLVTVVCSVTWLAAAALSLPVIIQRESAYDEYLEKSICFENMTGESRGRWRVGISVLRHTVGFFLPLAVMAVCYGWTVATLFHARNQQKRKAMRVILAVVLAFVLCWLPYNVAVLLDTLSRGGVFEIKTCGAQYALEVALEVTKVLAFTHCAVNPVLYAFIGEKFRNQLLSALFRHGLISKRLRVAFSKTSATSAGSLRSRNTSVTM